MSCDFLPEYPCYLSLILCDKFTSLIWHKCNYTCDNFLSSIFTPYSIHVLHVQSPLCLSPLAGRTHAYTMWHKVSKTLTEKGPRKQTWVKRVQSSTTIRSFRWERSVKWKGNGSKEWRIDPQPHIREHHFNVFLSLLLNFQTEFFSFPDDDASAFDAKYCIIKQEAAGSDSTNAGLA